MEEFFKFLSSSTSTVLNTDVDIDIDKTFDAIFNLNSNVDVDDNLTTVVFDAEAVGPNSVVEVDVSVLTLDNTLSSASGTIIAATSSEDIPVLPQIKNISYVVDGSNSITEDEYDLHLAAVQASIDDLRTQFTEGVDDVEIQLVQFSGALNPSGLPATTEATYDLFDPALDDVSALDVFDPQIGPPPSPFGPQTNWEAALDEAVEFFTGNDGDNAMLFISDGDPNRPFPFTNDSFTDEVAELEALGVIRQAVTFDPAAGPDEFVELNLIDSNDGAVFLDDPADIVDVFPPDGFHVADFAFA